MEKYGENFVSLKNFSKLGVKIITKTFQTEIVRHIVQFFL